VDLAIGGLVNGGLVKPGGGLIDGFSSDSLRAVQGITLFRAIRTDPCGRGRSLGHLHRIRIVACLGSKTLRPRQGIGTGRLDLERVHQERVVTETRVPLAALGIEDPEGRSTPRRTVAVVRDERLRALPDDVAAEPDPRPASQLEPDAGRLVDRRRETAGRQTALAGRIEDQQQGLRAPGERRESMESVGDPGRLVGPRQPAAGQVEDEQVDRPTGEERARDAQALVEAGRRDDHEPLETDPARHCLDRVETARQVEPGHDRALGLGLCCDAQAEGRPTAGAGAADRDAGRPREAARPEDRIERGEASADDAVIRSGVVLWLDIGRRKCLGGRSRQGQRAGDPRSCGTPSSPEARDSGVHITTTGRHRTPRVEHLF
jgi:hypothetical protein